MKEYKGLKVSIVDNKAVLVQTPTNEYIYSVDEIDFINTFVQSKLPLSGNGGNHSPIFNSKSLSKKIIHKKKT